MLGAMAVAYATAVTAQYPPRPPAPLIVPQGPAPQPPHSVIIRKGVSAEDAAAYRKARADYDECRRAQSSSMHLTEAADNVIHVRDRRAFWESELKRNSTMRLNHPGGYEQLLASTFQEYRNSGGAATTVDAVRPVAAPCARPAEPTVRGPSPVIDTKSLAR